MTLVEDIVIRKLGRVEYQPTWEKMRAFTRGRQDSTPDELWLLEHEPVYTVGQGATVPAVDNAIPIVKTDRGGDITYHAPGQIVVYTLVDLARRSIKVKRFVWLLEQAVLDLLRGRGERKAPLDHGARVRRRPPARGAKEGADAHGRDDARRLPRRGGAQAARTLPVIRTLLALRPEVVSLRS